MNKNRGNGLLTTIIDLINTIQKEIAFSAAMVFVLMYASELSGKKLLVFAIVIYLLFRGLIFDILQLTTCFEPRWLDLNTIMDNYKVHMSSAVLVGIKTNPKHNNKFSEYDFVSNDKDNDDLYASMIIHRKTGRVVQIIYPSYENNKRKTVVCGPSHGFHPTLALGQVSDKDPVVFIEKELAELLVMAIRASDARNINEPKHAYKEYMEEFCYCSVMRWQFTTIKNVRGVFPTSHNLERFTRDE